LNKQSHAALRVDVKFACALALLEGDGVRKDVRAVAQLFMELAELGHSGSLYELGNLYRRGSGVAKDLRRAAALYEQSGSRMALHNFARM
jgi:TPR repeat protein